MNYLKEKTFLQEVLMWSGFICPLVLKTQTHKLIPNMDLIYHCIFCYLLLPHPQQPVFKLPQNESQLLNVLPFLTLITFPDSPPQIATTHPVCSHSNLFTLDHSSMKLFAIWKSF